MGFDSKSIPPLPAPTETETNTPTELTTDISKPGDEKSSYSIPDDGTPVTIRTRSHRASRSQTSLLIEYFEASKSGNGTDRKPSVRVRLTPSKKGRGDHLQFTETKGSRKTSVTRRIPLDYATSSREIELLEGEDAHSMSSYASQTEESNVSHNPIDIEIDRSHRRRRPASPLIPSTTQSYAHVNESEISAIPADSFLDGSGPNTDYKRSSSPSRANPLIAAGAGALAGAAASELSNAKSRRSGREHVKIVDKSKESAPERKRRPKSRATSVSEHTVDEPRSRRRSSRSHQESAVSAADSSVLSSQLSPSHRSYETHSMRSGVSINNPKLLETVEDAIRRLILPELSALKREQSKRESRRGSITSTGTSLSREDLLTDRRRSSGQRSDFSKDGSRTTKERRNREARHDYDVASAHSISRESFHDDYEDPDGTATPKRSHDMLKAAATGAAVAKGMSALEDKSEDRKQRDRRRRRADGVRSRSLGRERYAEEYDDEPAPAPPMPLMSEINPSDITRTSILSANTDRPHSASEQMESAQEVSRGMLHTPSDLSQDLQQTLGTSHANVSHGDLNALPRGVKTDAAREYEVDEFGRKIPVDYHEDYEDDLSDAGDYPDDNYNQYYSTQDVPPPLKYVPYQAGARGLSPIPSVSGYTEGGSEAQYPRHSFVSDAHSSPDKSMLDRAQYAGSAHSLDSVPSNMRSREFDRHSMDDNSVRSAGADYRNSTLTAESEVNQGHAVRGNPNLVHPAMGVESAVASLVDGSMLEQSVLSGEYAAPRESMLSYDTRTSSRGVSPEKYQLRDERHSTPGARSQAHSQDFSEYEIDEDGRKFAPTKYRQSPTASEAAITAGAVGAAAAALKAAQERKQATGNDEWVGAGVGRNKSFKERTMEGFEPRNTPAHSVDRFSYEEPRMGVSGLPDMNDPMPEIGYVDDDARTSSSIVQDRLDGDRDFHDSGRATPTQASIADYGQVINSNESIDGERGLGITEAAGAAALGAAMGMAAAHSREPSQDHDEWQRTSEDRKRDTLLTNPYENASPIVNPALNENILGAARGLDATYGGFHTGSPGFGQKYDEGYMSNGPNRTPDVGATRGVGFTGPPKMDAEEDPFYTSHGDVQHHSGMSQGMASPLYDSAMGTGIDRIENKDIVALMQHLMVRDAQRSARDTEVVALLMSSALEMRNSFREMKDLIQDTGDDVIFTNMENTEKLQKSINGPRPFPGTGSRSIQSSDQNATIDSAAQKKKNLWKRALAGLSQKGTSDLSRIEDMLNQLLGEVDVLKTQTAPGGTSANGDQQSFMENLQPEGHYEQDRGYEPEGVSTASHASQSGHLSIPPSRGQGSRHASERRISDNRVSTVQENDEEYLYDHPSPSRERPDAEFLSIVQREDAPRGGSVPPDSPSAHASSSQQHALSADNTPRTDRGKKHKSSNSSGWLPKISRWSETTASSVGRALRGNGKKDLKYDENQQPSRSGSSLASYEEGHYRHDPYGEDKLHSGFSEPNLAENTPPLNPAQAAMASQEDPKYKAHRNSLNLQHPQPRPGGGERFRTALEVSAQEFDKPSSPRSADWAGSATSLHRLPQNSNRHSNGSSMAARDPEYWPNSPTQAGPPRPPKEPLDASTRTPPRARISKLAQGSPLQHQVHDTGYLSPTGSPKPEHRTLSGVRTGGPTRRPSGPRAMTPKSPEEEAAREERRRKRDTFGSIASQDTDTF